MLNWFDYIDVENLPADLKQEAFNLIADYNQADRFNNDYRKSWLETLEISRKKLLDKINDLLLIET